jgi:hypothetical protein
MQIYSEFKINLLTIDILSKDSESIRARLVATTLNLGYNSLKNL